MLLRLRPPSFGGVPGAAAAARSPGQRRQRRRRWRRSAVVERQQRRSGAADAYGQRVPARRRPHGHGRLVEALLQAVWSRGGGGRLRADRRPRRRRRQRRLLAGQQRRARAAALTLGAVLARLVALDADGLVRGRTRRLHEETAVRFSLFNSNILKSNKTLINKPINEVPAGNSG